MKGPNNGPWADQTVSSRAFHAVASLGGQLWAILPQEWLHPRSSRLPWVPRCNKAGVQKGLIRGPLVLPGGWGTEDMTK